MERPAIYTVGYGNRSFTEFADLLKRFRLEYLVDVRTSPYSSRFPAFSQSELAPALSGESIRYVFMGDQLGGRPSDPECYIEGRVNYQVLELRSFFQQGISRLLRALSLDINPAIMCSEKRPEDCHRSKLIGYDLARRGVEVLHIDEAGLVKTQEQIMSRLGGNQPLLFADETPSWRMSRAVIKKCANHNESIDGD